MSFNLLVVDGGDTDWCTSSHGKTRFYLRKNSEVSRGSKQCPCPLIFHQREPRGDQHVNEWLPAETVTPDLANIIFPSLQLHQYRVIGILHKTQEAGRKYIFEICLFSISKFLLFLFLHISTNPSQQRKFLCCRTNIYIVYIHVRGEEEGILL